MNSAKYLMPQWQKVQFVPQDANVTTTEIAE